MRYKQVKFDVNSIYESKEINSIRLFFVMWSENVNAIVKTNFDSIQYNFNVELGLN